MMRPASSQRHQVLLGRRQRPRAADPEAGRRHACSIRRCPRCGWTRSRRPTTGGQRQGHGVQLRRAPRAEGARPHAAVRHRARRTRGGRADARRAPRRRPASVEIGMPVRATYIDFPEGKTGPGLDAVRMGAGRSERTIGRGRHEAAGARRCTATRRSSCRRPSPPATTRTSTTTATRRRPRGPRTSSSTSSPTPDWCSASSPTGRARPRSIKSIGLRLGVPWYAYDTVTFNGEVTAVDDGLDHA